MSGDRIVISDEKNHKARRIPHPEPEGVVWFAMSAPYCRELKAQALLDEKGVENYVPMHYVIKEMHGRKKRFLVPVIHNLIFVHCTRDTIRRVKEGVDYLQFKTIREAGKNVPIVVPDRQMEDFMRVCESHDASLRFFRPGEVDLARGTKVHINGGEFDGVSGVFIKLAGTRERRVVVEIPLVASVATAVVSTDLIEVIKEEGK